MPEGCAKRIDERGRPRRGGVVVGIDGSDNAEHALRWASGKADILGSVTPVVAYDVPSYRGIRRARDADLVTCREEAETQLRDAVTAADPSLRGAGRLVQGHPSTALLEASADADLLVLGTRGQSGLTSTLLGSVSAHCASHAAIPVAVIPPYCPTDRPLLDLVVGIDGSWYADEALRWAIEHLAPGGRLRAVGAMPIWGVTEGGSRSLEDRLADQVEASIERVLERAILPDDEEREIVVIPSPRDARVVLREIADDGADLLVVGRRGLSRISFLLVGSVTAALIHHPTVPTVVIPTNGAGSTSTTPTNDATE